MLGWIKWEDRRRTRLEGERLLELPLLTLGLPDRERGRERRVTRGARLLAERRVTRVLTPPGFAHWGALAGRGLRPVDTQALRCALAPAWVRAVLALRGVQPENAVLRLEGAREGPDMVRVARALCLMVRNLVIETPGGGALAASLRREFGLPVLPARSARADLTLTFDSGPVLAGSRFALHGVQLPEDCERLPLLSALWENGRIKTEQIAFQFDFS